MAAPVAPAHFFNCLFLNNNFLVCCGEAAASPPGLAESGRDCPNHQQSCPQASTGKIMAGNRLGAGSEKVDQLPSLTLPLP
jgi:hypothetical protein